MHKIDSDLRRQQALHDNEQRIFKKQGLLYNFEPTMVVERPASPQKFVEQCEEADLSTPHYMTGKSGRAQPHHKRENGRNKQNKKGIIRRGGSVE